MTQTTMDEPRTAWFTFGVGHSHTVDGFHYDCDVIVEVTAPDPRAVMLATFGREWCWEHRDRPDGDMHYYPRGVRVLGDEEAPRCPRGCASWERCDEPGMDCSAENGPGDGERHGMGVCRTGRCVEPCGANGGCAR